MPDSQKKILIIEDDGTIRGLVRLYLVRSPFTFYDASDGMDGLAMAIQIVPDLIITDLMMPRMDGIDLIKAVRGHEKLKAIPIIALSGANYEEHSKAMQAGALTVLEKPVNHFELRQAISVFLPVKT